MKLFRMETCLVSTDGQKRAQYYWDVTVAAQKMKALKKDLHSIHSSNEIFFTNIKPHRRDKTVRISLDRFNRRKRFH